MSDSEQIKKFRQEIIKRDLEIKKLALLVVRDPLTGLFNRRGFLEGAGRILEDIKFIQKNVGARRHFFVDSLSIILFDIDHFKKFNDEYGHKLGDQILQYVSNIIDAKVRNFDIVGRWGGEELVVAMIGSHKKDAFVKAEEIRKAVRSRIWAKGGKKLRVSLSGGVADVESAPKGANLEDIIACADKAMYQAKQKGRDMIIIYSK